MTTRRNITPYTSVRVKRDIKTNMQLIPAGDTVEVEDYWDTLTSSSWMNPGGNPAALVYNSRVFHDELPFDNDVVYVKYDGLGSLIHISELEFDD